MIIGGKTFETVGRYGVVYYHVDGVKVSALSYRYQVAQALVAEQQMRDAMPADWLRRCRESLRAEDVALAARSLRLGRKILWRGWEL